MRALLILLMVCLISGKLCGQSFYVTDRFSQVRKVTVSNGTVTESIVSTCAANGAQSIALNRNTLYYIEGVQLYKSTIVNGAMTNCTNIGSAQAYNSMTTDRTGLLYLTSGNKVLQTFDPATKVFKTLGILNYTPSGDLIFYNNDLYLAAVGAGIVRVNIADPSKSTLVVATNIDVTGITIAPVNSTLNKVYALSSTSTQTTVYEVDLDNMLMGPAIGQPLPFYVWDSASDVEDGTYQTLDIDDIKTTADCPYTGRGTVQVISNSANSNYRYTLGNTTNSTGIFTNVSPGPYTVTVTNGPDSKQTPINVAQFQLAKPTVIVTKTDPKCLDKGFIAITANADADKYEIVFQGNAYPLNRNFDLPAGTYQFDIRNLSGCIVDTYSVTLTQQTCEIVLNDVKVDQDCSAPKKGTVTVHTTPGTDKYYYAMDNGTPNTTGIFNGLDAGDHQLKITSDGGGLKTLTVTVQDLSANDPSVTYIKTDAGCSRSASVKFDISFSNLAGYSVMLGNATYAIGREILLPDSGRYTFKIMKPGGCLLKEEVVQITKQACELVSFPNTFTPNNDGINDIFRPIEGTTADRLNYRIFNRLGTLVYSSENTKTGWDGSYRGKPAPAGVYYWMASYINNEGRNLNQNGSITLIR